MKRLLLVLPALLAACSDNGAGLENVRISFVGQVLWEDGTPIAGSMIKRALYACSGCDWGTAFSDAAGKFETSYWDLCIPGEPSDGLVATCDRMGIQSTRCVPVEATCGEAVHEVVCTCAGPG